MNSFVLAVWSRIGVCAPTYMVLVEPLLSAPAESYGDLFTSILMNKLPSEIHLIVSCETTATTELGSRKAEPFCLARVKNYTLR